QDDYSTAINDIETTAGGNKQTITNIQNNPENTIVGYQQVTETADLYERVVGSSENEINDNVSRIIAASDVIQQEVSSMEFGGRNYFIKSESEPNKLLEWAS
ncbi:hypothetical protein, partial [Salmonella enterica]|uniref:hypothetical protein n=1 Tax=Salmonella enterica TaxID=28901 RepID=UPI000CB3CD70